MPKFSKYPKIQRFSPPYKKNCRIVEAAKGKMLSAQLKQLRFLNICHRIIRLSPRGGRQMQMTLAEFLFARNFSTSTKLLRKLSAPKPTGPVRRVPTARGGDDERQRRVERTSKKEDDPDGFWQAWKASDEYKEFKRQLMEPPKSFTELMGGKREDEERFSSKKEKKPVKAQKQMANEQKEEHGEKEENELKDFLPDNKLLRRLFFAFCLTFPFFVIHYWLKQRSDSLLLPNDPNSYFAILNQITWNNFVELIVPLGRVSSVQLKVSHGADRKVRYKKALVTVMQGARWPDGKPLPRMFFVNVPDISRVEQDIRKAEVDAGLPPERWSNIQWVEPGKIDLNNDLFMSVIIPSLVILAFFVLPIILFGRMMSGAKMGNFAESISTMMGHRLRIYDPALKSGKLKIKFRDVAGLHEAKVEVIEFVDYLRRPKKYTRLGARLPKGALLTGPPGCGKTLLAKALAAESSVPFININGTEFVEMIGGLGASRIRQLFKAAKSRAPCIIYIDEIDAIGRKRNSAHGNDEQEHTLNQLLVEMDGMDTAKGIVVIGSTNRPDMLDKALLRPGRFDRNVSVDLPTLIERRELFDLYLRKIKKDNRLTGISHRLAQLTPGFSGADIANVVNESAIHAATIQKKMVDIDDVDYALQKILAGPEKRSKVLVKEEREVVAYHESGHALVGWLLEHTEALLKVTIIPRTSAALGFAQYSPKDRKLFTREELIERICMMLGGRAAENVTFGRITTGAQNDLEKVTKQAQAMVKMYGMSDLLGPISFTPEPGVDDRSALFQLKPYSKKLGSIIDQEVSRIVSDAYFFTEKLLLENRHMLETLAHALLEQETLSYDDQTMSCQT
uniref:AAA+ ATPase domain-containing protein n=1 Tax=Globodera rostochiensis TaxID=31243 RepID=A0A914I8N1_GLORO